MADAFSDEFDALLSKADRALFEDVIWLRAHGEDLDKAAGLVEQAIKARADFTLERADRDAVRERSYLLKTATGKEVAFINLRLEGPELVLWPTASPSGLAISNLPPRKLPRTIVSETSIRSALAGLASDIENRPKPATTAESAMAD